MANEQKADKGQQEAELPNSPIIQPPAAPPQQPPAPPNINQSDGNPEPPRPPEPILVQLVGGDDLEPFEEQTLAISRRTYWVTIFAFLAAAAAAVFIGVQVYEMTKQTQILATQSEGANAGALIDEMNTRKQLGLVEKQVEDLGNLVKQARGSVAIAREKDRPRVVPQVFPEHFLGIYQREQTNQIFTMVRAQNVGDMDARFITIAAKIEFRNSGPKPSECKFRSRDYKGIPGELPPFDLTKKFVDSPYFDLTPNDWTDSTNRRKVFVWGSFSYYGTAGEKPFVSAFCRSADANEVRARLAQQKGAVNGAGYGGPYDECDCK